MSFFLNLSKSLLIIFVNVQMKSISEGFKENGVIWGTRASEGQGCEMLMKQQSWESWEDVGEQC